MSNNTLTPGTIAIVTGPLRTTYGLSENYDDVYLTAGERVEVLDAPDSDNDVYVRGLDSGEQQYINAESLTIEGVNEVVLKFAFPNGEQVRIVVDGWEDPTVALSALQRAGSPETLAELAEGFLAKMLGELNIEDVLAEVDLGELLGDDFLNEVSL